MATSAAGRTYAAGPRSRKSSRNTTLNRRCRPCPPPRTGTLWYESLQAIGIEGLVVKAGASTYRGGSRQRRKVRHAETVDAVVVGFTGAAVRPRHLVVCLPDGRIALSQTLTAPLAAQVALVLRGEDHGPQARTSGGDAYRVAAREDVIVEVLSGTTRHAVVTVTRVR